MRTIANEKSDAQVCGTCKWHEWDQESDGSFVCINFESPNNADWTEYDDSCEEWEEK